MEDAIGLARGVVEASIAATTHSGVSAFLDTFVDHDRGYYPRQGLVDRAGTPRPAFCALAHLQSLELGSMVSMGQGRYRSERGEVGLFDSPDGHDAVELISGIRLDRTRGSNGPWARRFS